MKQTLKVFVDRLRCGKILEISETLDPAFMDISEKEEVHFGDQIKIVGQAYLAEDWLIVRLSIEASVELVCALCNDPFALQIHVQNMHHEESLENIKDASFDLLPLIRETILLEIPFYPQCGHTQCKRRQEVEKYLKKESPASPGKEAVNGHKPFQDIL